MVVAHGKYTPSMYLMLDKTLPSAHNCRLRQNTLSIYSLKLDDLTPSLHDHKLDKYTPTKVGARTRQCSITSVMQKQFKPTHSQRSITVHPVHVQLTAWTSLGHLTLNQVSRLPYVSTIQ